jgi:hypothetical protein
LQLYIRDNYNKRYTVSRCNINLHARSHARHAAPWMRWESHIGGLRIKCGACYKSDLAVTI